MERRKEVSEGCGDPSCWPLGRLEDSGLHFVDQVKVSLREGPPGQPHRGPCMEVGYRSTKKAYRQNRRGNKPWGQNQGFREGQDFNAVMYAFVTIINMSAWLKAISTNSSVLETVFNGELLMPTVPSSIYEVPSITQALLYITSNSVNNLSK